MGHYAGGGIFPGGQGDGAAGGQLQSHRDPENRGGYFPDLRLDVRPAGLRPGQNDPDPHRDRQKADILGGGRVKIEFGREREMRSRPFPVSAKAKNAEKFCGLKSQNFTK